MIFQVCIITDRLPFPKQFYDANVCVSGCGHHGPDFVGAASVRSGKGMKYNNGAPKSIHVM